MSTLVRFQETGVAEYRSWPEADHVPAIGDQVDVRPHGADLFPDGEGERIGDVHRREWYAGGTAVVCYVWTRR